MHNLSSLSGYILAGKSTFTFHHKVSGNHLTFKVEQPDENTPHFVKVLTGQDNEGDFSFIGTIFNGATFRHSPKSRITKEADSVRVFRQLWERIATVNRIPETVDFLPSGKCCRCGRKLTVPESLHNGLGPECAKKV